MPNIITHKIFGEEAIKLLDKSSDLNKQEILRIIHKHEHLFYIGTNGPDFLFFHNAKPWEKFKSHKVAKIGNILHREGINEFYESAIISIREQKNLLIKERMIAYLMGHLCHWSLDKTAHPYIFYRTGDCKGKSASAHHRFESMMDAMMLKRYHDQSIDTYMTSDITTFDEEMLQAIARIYVPAIRDTLHTKLAVYDIRKALTSWKEIQDLLYDPSGKLCELLHNVESMINHKWLISGNIVPNQIDDTYDILNLENKVWYHPCTLRIASTASFLDLFEEGLGTACEAMKLAYHDIYKETGFALGHILNHEAYDTGMSPDMDMKHFDMIYDDF